MLRFWEILVEKGPYFLEELLRGLHVTVIVAIGALVVALVLGLVLALLRLSRWRVVRVAAIAYVELFRGTPALVQLFIIYFGLPDIGFHPTPFEAAIIGLGMNGAAYLSEVYRAGIQAIHRGQMEAAFSLGMTPARAMQYIVLPQAVRAMLPPIANFSIELLKNTALVPIVAVADIMFYARNLRTETFQSLHIYLIVMLIYLCMTLPMARIVARLERSRQAWR